MACDVGCGDFWWCDDGWGWNVIWWCEGWDMVWRGVWWEHKPASCNGVCQSHDSLPCPGSRVALSCDIIPETEYQTGDHLHSEGNW